jgi:hypothetical protein
MAKYKEGSAVIRGHKNWTTCNTKSNNLVSLNQASTSTVKSSSSKRSRTPPRRILEGWDHPQQDYHLVPYFLVGPRMPRPWGPPLMMYLPCPRAGWYRPWAPPPMHFHPGWSGSAEEFGHGGYYIGDSCYGHVSHQQDTRDSG